MARFVAVEASLSAPADSNFMRSARPAGVSRSLRRSGTAKSGPHGPPALALSFLLGLAQRICAGPSLLTCARHPAPVLLSPWHQLCSVGCASVCRDSLWPPRPLRAGAIVCPVRSGRSAPADRAPLRPRSLREGVEQEAESFSALPGRECAATCSPFYLARSDLDRAYGIVLRSGPSSGKRNLIQNLWRILCDYIHLNIHREAGRQVTLVGR